MDSLPAIDSALLPADVRSGDASQRKQYTAALSFEQSLLEQMLSSAMPSSGAAAASAGGDDDSSAGDAVSSHYAQMLPELLAQAVTQSGGLGLARQIYDAMQGPAAAASSTAGAGSGGTAAPADGSAA